VAGLGVTPRRLFGLTSANRELAEAAKSMQRAISKKQGRDPTLLDSARKIDFGAVRKKMDPLLKNELLHDIAHLLPQLL
jgi:hypothetical protein